MSTGAWVLVVAVVVAVAFGGWRARTDGRFRRVSTGSTDEAPLSVVEGALRDGRRATSSGTGGPGVTSSGTGGPGATSSGTGGPGATSSGTGGPGATAAAGEAPVVDPVETTASVLAGTPFEAELGERATLLQFSSAFCAPCRATRTVLGQVVAASPGVAHVEVDAEQHLDLVRRLGVLRTPTTLVLDAGGREVTRAGGAPRRDQVVAALDAL